MRTIIDKENKQVKAIFEMPNDVQVNFTFNYEQSEYLKHCNTMVQRIGEYIFITNIVYTTKTLDDVLEAVKKIDKTNKYNADEFYSYCMWA